VCVEFIAPGVCHILGQITQRLVNKIKKKQFGRPLTYNKLFTYEFRLNARYSRLANRERIPPPIDISLLISNIKEVMRKIVNANGLQKFLLDGKEFSELILVELNKLKYPKELHYIAIKELYNMETKFYKELIVEYMETKNEDSDLIWFDNHVNVYLDSMFRQHSNIFTTITKSIYLYNLNSVRGSE